MQISRHAKAQIMRVVGAAVMSEDVDPGEMWSFSARDHYLPNVTTAAVADRLCGYRLLPSLKVEFSWLATGVRRALAVAMTDKSDGPDRMATTQIRAELLRLADVANAAWIEIFHRNGYVDRQLYSVALSRWDGEGSITSEEGLTVGDPTDMRRFRSALGELEWLSSFLKDSANDLTVPKGSWRSAEKRRIRIVRGQLLAPIFESAFGVPVSANNYPSGIQKAPTPFMDFYQRMVSLAFGENATPDLSAVVKVACQLHRSQSVVFNEGLIPNL